MNDALKDSAAKALPLGLVDGNRGQIVNQLIGCAIAWGLAIVEILIILTVCDMPIELRVYAKEESTGLDLSLHGQNRLHHAVVG